MGSRNQGLQGLRTRVQGIDYRDSVRVVQRDETKHGESDVHHRRINPCEPLTTVNVHSGKWKPSEFSTRKGSRQQQGW